MCANIGVIVGPLIGGITSDPAANYPDLFGGIRWLEKFPYSPPNLLSAIFLCSALLLVFFGLEEVSTCHSNTLIIADDFRLTTLFETEMTLGYKLVVE